ncbi:hypothetical protein GCM10028808_60550 [Spirosoma migulaei]
MGLSQRNTMQLLGYIFFTLTAIFYYYPIVHRLRQALNTPPPKQFKGIRFTVSAEMDRGLVDHKK